MKSINLVRSYDGSSGTHKWGVKPRCCAFNAVGREKRSWMQKRGERHAAKSFFILFYLLICILTGSECSYGALSFGQAAPVFTWVTLLIRAMTCRNWKTSLWLFFFSWCRFESKQGRYVKSQPTCQGVQGKRFDGLGNDTFVQRKGREFCLVNRIAFPILLDKSVWARCIRPIWSYRLHILLDRPEDLNYIQGGEDD